MVPAREREQFREAVKTKIILEVAEHAPPEPLIRPAAGARPRRANCLAGELRMQNRWGN